MNSYKNLGLGLILALSVMLTAAPSEAAGKYKRKYGMAGCGVSTYVIKEDGKSEQIISWFINGVAGYFVSFAHPTWAMTSGTSNCVDDSQQVAMEQEVFMNSNLANLSKEAAAGQGAHLNALAEVLGCENKEEFSRFSQQNYPQLFETSSAKEVLSRYLNGIKSSEELRKSCERVS
jgi:hypothetical protein